MHKDFKKWHDKKKVLHERTDMVNVFFRQKEVWWVALGVNIGFEQDGKGEEFRRPVLIVKKYNQFAVLVVPLTTKIKKDNKYHIPCVLVDDELARSAIISQVRLIDAKRLIDKLGVATSESFQNIKKAIKAML